MEPARIDPVDRAHLRDPDDRSHVIHRYAPSPGRADLVRRFWIPVWDTDSPTVQRVLQYPVCLIVVSDTYARLVGPTTGLGVRELSGRGWAFGAMLQPALGAMALDASVRTLTDTHRDLAEVPPLAGLIDPLTAIMTADPHEVAGHARGISLIEDALMALGSLDEEGLLVNEIVEWTESDSEVLRVGQITERFGLTERTLQRLLLRRVGLGPKWLINRRRLHEVSERLQRGDRLRLADVAADLGYTDQAHLSRDFRTVTGMTPRSFAAPFAEARPTT